MADPLADLAAAGVAIWLDDLSRARLATDHGVVRGDTVRGNLDHKLAAAERDGGGQEDPR